MSSNSQEYETPDNLFNPLHEEFDFKMDLAASDKNFKVELFYDKLSDGLSYDWTETSWLNPPFVEVKKWVRKAFEDSTKYNSTIVMLVMVKANTNWWRDYVMKAKEVRFINQKVQFKNTSQGLRFPTCIIVFGRRIGPTKFSVISNGELK